MYLTILMEAKQNTFTTTSESEQKDYFKLAQDVLAKFKNLRSNKSWVFEMNKNNVELSRLSVNTCPFPAYHVKSVYNKSKEDLVQKIWGVDSEEKAKANDPKLVTWKCVDSGKNWKVITQTNSVVWPVWNRQLTFLQVRIDEGDHTYLVGTTIDRKDVKNLSYDHVIADLHMSVYDYHDNKNGTTTVDRITLLDPQGSIPVSLVTMYSSNLVNLFASWKD